MKPKMPIFQNSQLDGNSFFYPGSSTGVLLMHGFTATTAEVRLLADAFKKKDCTVSAPLLTGHGSTPQDLNRVKFQEWIVCVEAAYRELRRTCTKVIVGGESMGAVLALAMAESHPEIAALLLYSPALRVDSLKYSGIFKYFLPIVEKSNNDPDDHLWQGYTVYPLWAADQFRKLQKVVSSKLSLVNQPALILQGIYDKTIHPSCGSFILEQIGSKEKELKFMQHSGHVMLLGDELEEIMDSTLAFLKRADIL